MSLSKEIVYLKDFKDEADKLRANWGRTDMFSTGIQNLDFYLGGGYGRHNAYEIVLVFGGTGLGKSSLTLNMIKNPIISGANVGLMILEDSMPDVFIRMEDIFGDDYKYIYGSNIHCMPPEALEKSWTLDDLLLLCEEWFTKRNIDIILLDHLQFAFESADQIRGENEYVSQRIFMKKLNNLMKKINKTIILVSHVNKGKFEGMDKIVGSSGIAQAATKVIELQREEDNIMKLTMHKSRFTRRLDADYRFKFDGLSIKEIDGGINGTPF